MVASTLQIRYDFGSKIGSTLHLRYDFGSEPVIASTLRMRYDFRGRVGSTLRMRYDLGETPRVWSTLHMRYDFRVSSGPTPIPGPTIVPDIWWPLAVFDKAGTYLGSIRRPFNVTAPPTRYLRSKRYREIANMTFSISRHHPDIGLIADDRLVFLQSRLGEPGWAGTMSPQTSATGMVEVECLDAWQLLNDGPAITYKEDVTDGTPAIAILAEVMARHNDLRAAGGEITWGTDFAGSRVFHGDVDFDDGTLALVDRVIDRSRIELAWSADITSGRLALTLHASDHFDTGAGAALHDGVGANVLLGAQAVQDPSPIINSLRLTGMTTDLAKCLPVWAQWAAKDITPEVTVSVDPGTHRMRQRQDISVDWGLSDTAISAMCNAIIDWLKHLFASFLRGVHDIEGRPWHPGWAYLGVPDIMEPKSAGKDSLSRRAWKERLMLCELRPGQPASAVMLSDGHCKIDYREWLIVSYSRSTGNQNVVVWPFPTVKGASLVKWSATGTITIYKVSGGRVIGTSTTSGTGAFVDPYSVEVWDPVARRYRYLRRIINGPMALVYWVDPADADNHFVDLGPEAALDTRAGDGSSLIDKQYSFEFIDDWDPRRDGVGALLARKTVYWGAETSRPRWHIVSFNVGADYQSSIVAGLPSASPGTIALIDVESIFGAPDPYDIDANDPPPWTFEIGDGIDAEQVIVRSAADMNGSEWTIVRAQNGTQGWVHEPGDPIRRITKDGTGWDGFPWPPALSAWPEGLAWAQEELAEQSKARVNIDLHVSHKTGDHLTLRYGSMHAIDIATEGAPARWVGTGRCIGWSTNAPGGETEAILEWQV